MNLIKDLFCLAKALLFIQFLVYKFHISESMK